MLIYAGDVPGIVFPEDEIEEEDHVPLSKGTRKRAEAEIPPPKVVSASDPILVTPITVVPTAVADPLPLPTRIPSWGIG